MVFFSIPTLGRAFALVSLLGGLVPSSLTATAAPTNNADSSVLATRDASPWQARHLLTSSAFQSTFDSLVHDGYKLTYVSGYTLNDDPRFAAIWEKNVTTAWIARDGLTSAQYQAEFDQLAAQGYRVRLVDGYAVGGSARFAAIWDKSPAPGAGAWVARHGLSAADYQQAFDAYGAQGFRLACVSGYADAGQARYAAIWEKPVGGPAWVARHGLTSAQYQAAFDAYVAQGFRLVQVSGYVVDGVDYYAAIWDKAPSGPWVARHGLDAKTYQSEFDKWVGQGFRLTVVSAYTLNGNQDRYAALWVKE